MDFSTLTDGLPDTFWIDSAGRVVDAGVKGGHFYVALDLMRADGKGDRADALQFEYEDEPDDSVQFAIRTEGYEAAEALGWFRGIRHPRCGIDVEAPSDKDWSDVPKAVRARLEKAAFFHHLAVNYGGREMVDPGAEPVGCTAEAFSARDRRRKRRV